MLHTTRDVCAETNGGIEKSLAIEEIIIEPGIKKGVRVFQVKMWTEESGEKRPGRRHSVGESRAQHSSAFW